MYSRHEIVFRVIGTKYEVKTWNTLELACEQGDGKEKGRYISLTKLTVSHDLLRLTVTTQIVFDRRDSNMFPKFERMMDCCWMDQTLVSKLETPDAITFT